MFCRKCGTEIPDDSSFCTLCGTRVKLVPSLNRPAPEDSSREYIELFENVVARDYFDLYLADTRIVLIKTRAGQHGSLLAPIETIVGAGVNKTILRRKELTLDQKLRKDRGNLAIDYSSVDSVRLGRGKLGGMIFQVCYRNPLGAEERLNISVSGDQFDRLAVIIPSIPLLAPKFLELQARTQPRS